MEIQILFSVLFVYILSMLVMEPLITMMVLNDDTARYEVSHTIALLHTMLICSVLWAYGICTIGKFAMIMVVESFIRTYIMDCEDGYGTLRSCTVILAMAIRLFTAVITILF